jgi:hypothetical protein
MQSLHNKVNLRIVNSYCKIYDFYFLLYRHFLTGLLELLSSIRRFPTFVFLRDDLRNVSCGVDFLILTMLTV